MQEIFDTRPLGLRDGILILGAGLLLMIVLEVEKMVVRRYRLFNGALAPSHRAAQAGEAPPRVQEAS